MAAQVYTEKKTPKPCLKPSSVSGAVSHQLDREISGGETPKVTIQRSLTDVTSSTMPISPSEITMCYNDCYTLEKELDMVAKQRETAQLRF